MLKWILWIYDDFFQRIIYTHWLLCPVCFFFFLPGLLCVLVVNGVWQIAFLVLLLCSLELLRSGLSDRRTLEASGRNWIKIFGSCLLAAVVVFSLLSSRVEHSDGAETLCLIFTTFTVTSINQILTNCCSNINALSIRIQYEFLSTLLEHNWDWSAAWVTGFSLPDITLTVTSKCVLLLLLPVKTGCSLQVPPCGMRR